MAIDEDVAECPSPGSVEPGDLSLQGKCGDDLEIVEVTGRGTREVIGLGDGSEQLACCYPVEVLDHDPNMDCTVGRPYYEAGFSLVAPLLTDGASSAGSGTARARAWAKAGAGEHASVAAFARLAIQLMKHGAPSALLADVHRAAIDELRHAELCWSMAERLGGPRARAGAFPFATSPSADVSLAELAVSAVREGCLGETLAAHVAGEAAMLAPDPAVRRALDSIARDEARHAVLSYRIAAWAIRTGGPAVRAAVRDSLRSPWPRLDVRELSLRAGVDISLLSAAAHSGVEDVLEPAVLQLLAA